MHKKSFNFSYKNFFKILKKRQNLKRTPPFTSPPKKKKKKINNKKSTKLNHFLCLTFCV